MWYVIVPYVDSMNGWEKQLFDENEKSHGQNKPPKPFFEFLTIYFFTQFISDKYAYNGEKRDG